MLYLFNKKECFPVEFISTHIAENFNTKTLISFAEVLPTVINIEFSYKQELWNNSYK